MRRRFHQIVFALPRATGGHNVRFPLATVAHFGRTTIDRHFIQEHAAVIDGSAEWRAGRAYQGYCPEAVFDRFSIFVAAGSPYTLPQLQQQI